MQMCPSTSLMVMMMIPRTARTMHQETALVVPAQILTRLQARHLQHLAEAVGRGPGNLGVPR